MDFDEEDDDRASAKLPPLIGSERQVEWAASIRDARMCHAALLCDMSLARGSSRQQAQEYLKSLPVRTSAHWWIETRNLPIKAFLIAAFESPIQPPFVLPPSPSKAALAVLADATLAPTKVRGPVAEISLASAKVRVLLAEFDKDANSVLKRSGCRWDAPEWVMDAPVDIAVHRAVEIAVRLLAQGCPVRIFDDALRQRVMSNDYEPQPQRRVDVSTSEKYARKFRLTWALDKDARQCMWAARALHGAKVFDDAAYVSASHFEDIEDFARRNGFAITPEAQALIDAERQKLLGAVQVKARPKAGPALPPKPARAPATGAIDDALRDD